MGEAETKKSKALHNWMGDQDEKTLELSLGLPGGGGGGGQAGWRTPLKDKGRHSADADNSMLSLGYSPAAFSPNSQGMDATAPLITTSLTSAQVKCCS